MAKLQHKDATSCSVDGRQYAAGADGLFDVPDAAVAALEPHGFAVAPAPEPVPEPPRKPKGK
jgi:hypothetical protein